MEYQLIFPKTNNLTSTQNILPQQDSKDLTLLQPQIKTIDVHHNTSLKQIFQDKQQQIKDKFSLRDFMDVQKTQQVIINTETELQLIVQKNSQHLFKSMMKQQQKKLQIIQTSNISELQIKSSMGLEIPTNEIQNHQQFPQKKPQNAQNEILQQQLIPFKQQKYSIYLEHETFVQEKQNKFLKPKQEISKGNIIQKFVLKKKHSGEKCIIEFNNIAPSLKFQILNSTLKQCIAKKIVGPISSIIGIMNFCCLRKDQNFVIQISVSEKVLILKLLNGADLQRFVKIRDILKRKFWEINEIIVGQEQSIDFFLETQSELLKSLKNQLQSLKKLTEKALEKGCSKLIQYNQKILRNFQLREDQFKNINPTKLIKKKIYEQSGIFKLYTKFYKSQEEVTQVQKNKILASWSIQKIFKYLEVDQIYQLLPKNNELPYESAIKYLEKINYIKYPEQKIQCVFDYFKAIKNCCSQYHKNKYQLQTMDNILPVIIFTVLNSKLENGFANMKSLEHYIRLNAIKCDIESRIITNIYSAIQYITYTWQI